MGTGFTVTFRCDGTQTVDYSKIRPISLPSLLDPKIIDEITYRGSATGKITTKQISRTEARSVGEATKDGAIEGKIEFQISLNDLLWIGHKE